MRSFQGFRFSDGRYWELRRNNKYFAEGGATVVIDGKLCTITIPAGSDVASCVSADGSISVSALVEKFGSKAV
jgi:hypothetical protein